MPLTYSDEELINMAMRYFRTCKPKEYRQMKKDGELMEVCQLMVKAARRYAKNLMAVGIFAGEAWNRAIRLEILESETD